MNICFANKLKEQRKRKNVSQEKVAQYLGVSSQAVSKWENCITAPDITLLPDIARYFGITVDELLSVEQIDSDKCFEQCKLESERLFRDGKRTELVPLWLELYRKMPNDVRVKEMLMSIYFDVDKSKYQKEIIELATEIYSGETPTDSYSYYKGQAIQIAARTYYENGNYEKASEWAKKAHQLNHCQELLQMLISEKEEDLVAVFRFFNYWYLDSLFYASARLNQYGVGDHNIDYVKKVNETVAQIFETVYPDDDMSFESLYQLYLLHRCIAEDEMLLGKNEAVVRKHLERACECAKKSLNLKAHALSHPLVFGWRIEGSPQNNKQIVEQFREELLWECFDLYREREWFVNLLK